DRRGERCGAAIDVGVASVARRSAAVLREIALTGAVAVGQRIAAVAVCDRRGALPAAGGEPRVVGDGPAQIGLEVVAEYGRPERQCRESAEVASRSPGGRDGGRRACTLTGHVVAHGGATRAGREVRLEGARTH